MYKKIKRFMKNRIGTYTFWVICAIIGGLIGYYVGASEVEKEYIISNFNNEKSYEEVSDSLKVGQVYINFINDEDPFKEIEVDTITILDIKDNYIKYKKVYKGGELEGSERRDWFVYGLDSLIKDVK